METRTEASARRRYRLRGTIDDRERALVLPAEGGTIGGGSKSDLAIPVRGVSRLHARVSVEDDGLVVEDLDSKNGTFVNGVAIARSMLRVGDRLGLGPAEWVVEAIDPADAEIGLAVIPRTSDGHAADEATSHLSLRGPATGRWMSMVETCVALWPRSPDDGLAPIIRAVVAASGARAGAIVEWDAAAAPRLLAAEGRIGSLPDIEERSSRSEGRRDTSDAWVAGWVELVPSGRFGFVLWDTGRAEESLVAALRLLAAVGALVSRRSAAPAPDGDRVAERLRFPAGYVPGRSAAMMAVYDQLAALARTEIAVLLVGETGVGKEPLARALHDSSARTDKPFVAVNCAAIAADQLEAELFGVAKGAATGVSSRAGFFREADGGTLFLDEVGELPVGLQPKLLRALQEGEVRPIGAASSTVDVRVVSATNRDLESLVARGGFRGDLFYRLAGALVPVPPLRRRRADLAGLIGHLVRRIAVDELNRLVRGVSVKALERLEAFPWPGNVRQLENELRRAAMACPEGGFIASDMLSSAVRDPAPSASSLSLEPGAKPLAAQLDDVERHILRRALTEAGGNKSRAARQLGISRNGLAYRLKRLALHSVLE